MTVLGESGGLSTREAFLDVDRTESAWPLLTKKEKFKSNIISFYKKSFAG